MSVKIKRSVYADMFGPTVGDRVRLADTDLIIEVEKDFTTYGEEVKFGGGKVIRDGMGQSQRMSADVMDTVITNALIVDHWGIVKADIGLRGQRICAIGKAGNPDVQPGVDIVIGPGTEIIAGEGMGLALPPTLDVETVEGALAAALPRERVLAQAQRRQRRRLRGLQHDRVAGRQRRLGSRHDKVEIRAEPLVITMLDVEFEKGTEMDAHLSCSSRPISVIGSPGMKGS